MAEHVDPNPHPVKPQKAVTYRFLRMSFVVVVVIFVLIVAALVIAVKIIGAIAG